MPQIKQFLLPDPAEGLTEAEIVSWKVAVGDTVTVNQPIVDIETAKSLVELPCPFAGLVVAIHVEEGVTADVGTPIISIDIDPDGEPSGDTGDSGAGASGTLAGDVPAQESADERPEVGGPGEEMVPSPPDEGFVEPGLIGGEAPGGRTSVLVGYGPRTTEAKRRPRRGGSPSGRSDEATQAAPNLQSAFSTDRPVATPVSPPREPNRVTPVPASPKPGASLPSVGRLEPAPAPSNGSRVLAKPPVRKLARDLGVDLSQAAASGPNGTVTREDVMALAEGGAQAQAPASQETAASAVDTEREVRTPIKGVRKMTAEAMVRSAFTAPHVTEWVTVDVTRTMELVARLKTSRELEGLRISPLTIVAKALLIAVRRNPGINATWDDAAQEIVTKRYVNLGIAAATPRGLVVPNIKDADRLDLAGLAGELKALTDTAREGRTSPADMSGGHHLDHQRGRLRRRRRHTDPQPRRGGDPVHGPGAPDAVGGRRRAGGAPGHAAHALLRPPSGRRRPRLAHAGRRGRDARASRAGARLGLTRETGRRPAGRPSDEM